MTQQAQHEDDEIANVLAAEHQARDTATEHFMLYNPFLSLPTDTTMRVLSDYKVLLNSRNITGEECRVLVQNDFTKASEGLRARTASMLFLGAPRHAVLLHVALLIGIQALLDLQPVWEALRAQKYDQAAEELLLSDWPRMVGPTREERMRILDLARVIRTGVLPTALTH